MTQYGITEKPTTDCLSLHNNAGLMSKDSEEIACEKAENCRCRQPKSFDAPPQGTTVNIRINLISCHLGYIFAADSMGLSSFRFLWWAPHDSSFLQ